MPAIFSFVNSVVYKSSSIRDLGRSVVIPGCIVSIPYVKGLLKSLKELEYVITLRLF
jgi:hypothetical protein